MYLLAFREHLLDYHDMKIHKVIDSWKRILSVSLPATATNLIGPISTAIIVSMLAGYSQETVAGFGIASRIEALFVVPLSYGAWGILMMTSAIFNSLAKPISSTIMSIVRMFVIYVPLAYLGEFLFGYPGIFGAVFAANCLMGIFGFSWNRKVYLPQLKEVPAQC